jgi:tetratricopeptide (TPR) repeat protein
MQTQNVRQPVEKRNPARERSSVNYRQILARKVGSVTLADLVLAFLLVCLCFVAYSPALEGGLLWDDDWHIPNPAQKSLDGLWLLWTNVGPSSQYYPFVDSIFWCEYHLWGNHVFGYHCANLIQHITSALLLVAIIRRLDLPGAWMAAFIFALHPVNSESVAWMTEQKNTLSALFFLASLLIYLRFDKDRKPSLYLIASALFALALLSKTVTATLPGAILVLLWWRRGLFTSWVEKQYSGAYGPEFTLTFLQRILLAGRVVWFYIAKDFFPYPLIFVYERWNIEASDWSWYAYSVSLVIGLLILVRVAKRNRSPLAAVLLYIGVLFPVLGFFNIYYYVNAYVCDHFQYLACISLIAFFSSWFASVQIRQSLEVRALGTAFTILLIAALTISTWIHSHIYSSLDTLSESVIELNPDSWGAHAHLATSYANIPGRKQDALTEWQKALRLRPLNIQDHLGYAGTLATTPGHEEEALAQVRRILDDDKMDSPPEQAMVHNRCGEIYADIPGHSADAMVQYQEAIQLNPRFAEPHNNIGCQLEHMPGRLADAISEYREAIRDCKVYPKAESNLGNALFSAGEYKEGLYHLETAVQEEPTFAAGQYNLGMTLKRIQGRQQEAIPHLEAAIEADPLFLEAHYELGNCLAYAPGQYGNAIKQYEAAIAINPNVPEVHNNLAIVLQNIPGHEFEAWREYQTAIDLQPNNVEAHNNLASLLARIPGRTEEASQEYGIALKLSPKSPATHYNYATFLEKLPNEKQHAISEYETAISLDPNMSVAKAKLAMLLGKAIE